MHPLITRHIATTLLGYYYLLKNSSKKISNRKSFNCIPLLLSRSGKSGIPVVSDSGSLRRGLVSLFDTVSHCVVSLKDKVDQNSGFYHENMY